MDVFELFAYKWNWHHFGVITRPSRGDESKGGYYVYIFKPNLTHDRQVFGGKLNLGGQNGVKLVHACKPRYWIGTHDEVKRASGLVSKVLKRKIWTVEEALREAGLTSEDAQFIHLKSGDQIDLE